MRGQATHLKQQQKTSADGTAVVVEKTVAMSCGKSTGRERHQEKWKGTNIKSEKQVCLRLYRIYSKSDVHANSFIKESFGRESYYVC